MNAETPKAPGWSKFIQFYASVAPFVVLPLTKMGFLGIVFAAVVGYAGYYWALTYAVRARRAEQAQPPKDLVLGFIFYHACLLAPIAILARMLTH